VHEKLPPAIASSSTAMFLLTWFVTGSMDTMRAMIPNLPSHICIPSSRKHPNPRENYVAHLQKHENPEIQSMAKDLEKKFWSDLQERLDEVKQHPLPYHYQAPELVWKTMKKAVAADL